MNSTPSSVSATTYPYPGTTPAVSANGTSNGIVWAIESSPQHAAVLHAYDATEFLANEIYNSNQAANLRDSFGTGNKLKLCHRLPTAKSTLVTRTVSLSSG